MNNTPNALHLDQFNTISVAFIPYYTISVAFPLHNTISAALYTNSVAVAHQFCMINTPLAL
ncbi:hypothetical protein [Psychrobacillus sp. FSL H8-0510]|uniref:hypothetical protein n=1 Tax=Psychrobacillus sp. FSL H8-0510 TaxID=2921394 RepID=UPI0030F7392C